MRLHSRPGAGDHCLIANLTVHALVPTVDGATPCPVCTATSLGGTSAGKGLLAQMQPEEKTVFSSLDRTGATPRVVATEGHAQEASAVATVATGSNAAALAKEAIDSPAGPTERDSSSLRVLSNSEDANTVHPAAVSGSETLGARVPTPHADSWSAEASQVGIARVCLVTEAPPAVAGGAPVASIVAAPRTAGTAEKVWTQTTSTVTERGLVSTCTAEGVGEQTSSTMTEGARVSTEGIMPTKTSTSSSASSSPPPLEVAADVPCPLAGTPCSSGGADSREPMLSTAAAPAVRLGPPLGGPKDVEVVASSPVPSGLVVPRTSYFAPGNAAPTVVVAQESADSITPTSEEGSALSVVTSKSKATATGRAAAPPLVPSRAPPSSPPPVSGNDSLAGAFFAPPLGTGRVAAAEGSAKPPSGTAEDGLPSRREKQLEGGGALSPARGVSPLLGGASDAAGEASARPLPTAGDGSPLRGRAQPARRSEISLPARGISPPVPAATAAEGQSVDVVPPSGLEVEIEESLGLDHGPTDNMAECVPAKNAVAAPQSPLSALAHMAATSFGTSRSDLGRGRSVSGDREMEGATDEEAAVVISLDVGGLASSVTQAGSTTVAGERGPSLEDLRVALSLVSRAVGASAESEGGRNGLGSVFGSLRELVGVATRTRSVEANSLEEFMRDYDALGRKMAAIKAGGSRNSAGDTRVEGVVEGRGSDGIGTSPSGHVGTSPAREGGASGWRRGGESGGGSGGEGPPSTPRELKFLDTGIVCLPKMIVLEAHDTTHVPMLAQMVALIFRDACVGPKGFRRFFTTPVLAQTLFFLEVHNTCV